MEFKAYPKIGQFRQVIKHVQMTNDFDGVDENGDAIYTSRKKPVLTFTGTVKTHGTNAGVQINLLDEAVQAQSRNNLISVGNDNAGFAGFVHAKKDAFLKIAEDNFGLMSNHFIVYGEWIGSNIQKGVGVSELSKRLIVFDVRILVEEEWVWLAPEEVKNFVDKDNDIYNTYDFPTYTMDIDFDSPKSVQNDLIALTEAVEKECPVAKAFDVSGIGEGIVWKADVKNFGRMLFKVKGEKHSVSKVKKLVEVDTEKLNSINEFVDYAVTENRLEQMYDTLFTKTGIDPDRKHTGDFLRALVNDVMSEEVDTLVDNGLEAKEVNGKISLRGREWFFSKID